MDNSEKSAPEPTSFYARYGIWICIAVFLCMPFLLYGATNALASNQINILDWLPTHFGERARLFWFVEKFGSDEIMVVSWPTCTVNDERLDRLAEELVKPASMPGTTELYPLFRKVFTGRQILDDLTSEPLNLTSEQASDRMRGWLIGPNGQTTCAVALVSEAGEYNRHRAVERVYEVAADLGLTAEELRVGGPTADGVSIDRAAQRWMMELGLAAVIISVLIASLCLRQFRLVVILFLSAIFAWSLSLSVLYYSGGKMDPVLLLMPALVFVLSISGGVHLSNYYRDALADGVADASAAAIQRGWLPCSLASITTCIGIGSLAISHITPIRKFGIFAALGILFSLLALMVLWPSIAAVWRVARGPDHGVREPASKTSARRWWQPLLRLSLNHSSCILILAAVTLPVFGWGLTKLRTSTEMQDLLREDSKPLRDFNWLAENLGAVTPVEVVLGFPHEADEDARTMLARAELVEGLREKLAKIPDVGATMAATTFAPLLPEGSGARNLIQRRVVARRLMKYREDYEQLRYLKNDTKEELWRISLRVSSTNADYGNFLAALRQQTDSYVEEAQANVSVTMCGAVPLIFMAQHQLLVDLIESFLLAFCLVAITMMILMRSFSAGLASMLPNVFPALVAFGYMGLAGTAIDIGTMMTASAAMGIAVDDTLHFLVWFRRGISRGETRPEAVRYAFQNSATAMLQTSVICGLGLLVFVVSPFAPVSRFARVMSTLLMLALLGDLVLLPSLLVGPLGRWFEPRHMSAQVRPPAARAVET